MPLWASEALAVRAAVPTSGAAGTVNETVGTVLSTMMWVSKS